MNAQTLPVPGATLYYETRGAGPLLLLIAGGSEDAASFEGLADILARDYTVVTYDPRGNSRSPLARPPKDQRIPVHSDDARRLLETVTNTPAGVFGSSSGAIVGLDLIARYPGSVARLVAHEPPMFEVLPDPSEWRALAKGVAATYRRKGVWPAMRQFAAGIGLNTTRPRPRAHQTPEAEAALKRMTANFELFLAHELIPFSRYVPDLPALDASKERIVLAGGEGSRATLPARPAAWLAEHFGTQVVEFPGDHAGYAAQPAAFAARLREVMSG